MKLASAPAVFLSFVLTAAALAQSAPSSAAPSQASPPAAMPEQPSSSLVIAAQQQAAATAAANPETANKRVTTSLYAIALPEPRKFQKHDLVQIIVREASQAKSSQNLDIKKDYSLDAKVKAWPDFNLEDLLNFQLYAGRTVMLPEMNIEAEKEFKGDGDYGRKDDLTARLTAEVIEVLPNGNLIIEARTDIKVDKEHATMKVTGICRPDDVSPANSVLSSQIHDLKIEKMHTGELKNASKKGIVAKVLEALFAF